MHIVGVAGGTGAGKTSLVHHLLDRLDASVLPVDAYYLDRSALPPDERARLNYDEPAAIDLDLLVSHVQELGTFLPGARGPAVTGAVRQSTYALLALCGPERVLDVPPIRPTKPRTSAPAAVRGVRPTCCQSPGLPVRRQCFP
jgi:hypothetical protein